MSHCPLLVGGQCDIALGDDVTSWIVEPAGSAIGVSTGTPDIVHGSRRGVHKRRAYVRSDPGLPSSWPICCCECDWWGTDFYTLIRTCCRAQGASGQRGPISRASQRSHPGHSCSHCQVLIGPAYATGSSAQRSSTWMPRRGAN